ncbi:hypothetical protein AYI70_g3948 [Smittium culicis]|uniref:Uncharacterized protein n=1 Tax=Smittium culicis TaxID=133412 RepID=A0A1R1Y1V9_9FUNG|nr:hypothetical protein AYI70_g3948 [Smittium culicis]
MTQEACKNTKKPQNEYTLSSNIYQKLRTHSKTTQQYSTEFQSVPRKNLLPILKVKIWIEICLSPHPTASIVSPDIPIHLSGQDIRIFTTTIWT